jgi:hypothetical protein
LPCVVMLAGLMLLILTAAETAIPRQVYFRLHNDDELVAKP